MDMQIEIATPQSGDFGPALDAIFADGLEPLVPSRPFYWQDFARSKLVSVPSGTVQPATAPLKNEEMNVGGDILPPELLENADPVFSNEARNLRYSGNSLIGLIVSRDGVPKELRVVKPLGLGMDEQALGAASRYRFKPASKNGTTVAVRINIEVDFKVR